ncbi:MAG TPA: monofunctional biosynthetic peptidoglycan transglycosylase [Gammaproteobacteria bacterium]|nr:monofunctional biosynthetic peptidoglycan transglycosylase [Gammaproteobacteria bacterium]
MARSFQRRRNFLRCAIYALIGACLLSAGAAALLRFVDPPVTSVMLLEPGAVSALDYRWVSRGQIAEPAARAVIAAEDQRFLAHHGLDFSQIRNAVEAWRRGGELRGASTITQQVAKNVYLWNGRSFVRKTIEAWLAILIDVLVPKDRQLEIYLNIAEFGPGIFGIEAAAVHYFGRPAAQLRAHEAASLAAVLPNPRRMSANPPGEYVRLRRREILEQMGVLEERGHFTGLSW